MSIRGLANTPRGHSQETAICQEIGMAVLLFVRRQQRERQFDLFSDSFSAIGRPSRDLTKHMNRLEVLQPLSS